MFQKMAFFPYFDYGLKMSLVGGKAKAPLHNVKMVPKKTLI